MLKTTKFGAKRLIAAASSLALVGGLAVATPAVANGGGTEEAISNSTLNWRINDLTFSGRLATPYTVDTTNYSGDVSKVNSGEDKYWKFENGSGVRDIQTGAYQVNYTGTLKFGAPANQGGYMIVLSNPSVVVSGGKGKITADVEYGLLLTGHAAKDNDRDRRAWSTKERLKVAELPSVPDGDQWTAAGVAAADVEGDYTSPNIPGSASFAEDFTGFLANAATLDAPVGEVLQFGQSSLSGHFQQTNNGATQGGKTTNESKVLRPLTADLDVAYSPKLELIGATGIPLNKAKTVTVKGSGFDPALRTAGLYVAFGPNADKINKQDIGNVDAFYSAVPLFGAFPNARGQFQTTLKVTGIYKSNQGKTYDGRKTPLGVSVWAAHTDSVASYRQFAQVSFAQGATAYSKPGKVKKLKRKANKKRTKLKVSWAAPTATKVEFRDNKAVRYQVRVTNYKGKKYSKWKNRTSRSLNLNTKRKGTYKFQVRAVSKAGAGSAVSFKYLKR